MAAARHRSRGHIETRANGKFRVKVYAGEDPLTGKQRYLTKTTGSYKEAEVELTALLGQIDGNRHPRSSVTVAQVVAQWLEAAELADTTRQRYEGLVRLYVEPALGAHPATGGAPPDSWRPITRRTVFAVVPLIAAAPR